MFSSSNFRFSKGLFNFAEKLILGLEFFIFIFESVFFSLHYCVDFFILFYFISISSFRNSGES